MSKPTAAQKRRWNKIAALGCLPCRMDGNEGTPATISHCHCHGYRNHDTVFGACPAHHLTQFAVPGVPNLEKDSQEFHARYGSFEELHDATCILLGEAK